MAAAAIGAAVTATPVVAAVAASNCKDGLPDLSVQFQMPSQAECSHVDATCVNEYLKKCRSMQEGYKAQLTQDTEMSTKQEHALRMLTHKVAQWKFSPGTHSTRSPLVEDKAAPKCQSLQRLQYKRLLQKAFELNVEAREHLQRNNHVQACSAKKVQLEVLLEAFSMLVGGASIDAKHAKVEALGRILERAESAFAQMNMDLKNECSGFQPVYAQDTELLELAHEQSVEGIQQHVSEALSGECHTAKTIELEQYNADEESPRGVITSENGQIESGDLRRRRRRRRCRSVGGIPSFPTSEVFPKSEVLSNLSEQNPELFDRAESDFGHMKMDMKNECSGKPVASMTGSCGSSCSSTEESVGSWLSEAHYEGAFFIKKPFIEVGVEQPHQGSSCLRAKSADSGLSSGPQEVARAPTRRHRTLDSRFSQSAPARLSESATVTGPSVNEAPAEDALLQLCKYVISDEFMCKLPNLSEQNPELGFQVRISGIPLEAVQDDFYHLVHEVKSSQLPIRSLILSDCLLQNNALQTLIEAVASQQSHCDCLLDLSDNLPDENFVADPSLMTCLARSQRRIVRLSSIYVSPAVQAYLSKVEDICANLRKSAIEEAASEEPSLRWWSAFFSERRPTNPLAAGASTFQTYIQQQFDTPKKRLRMPRSGTPHKISFKLASDVPYPEDDHHREQLRHLLLHELAAITGLPAQTFKRVVLKRGSVQVGLILCAGAAAVGVASAVLAAFVRRRLELAAFLGPEFVLGRIDQDTIQEGPITAMQDLLEHLDGRKRILFLDGGGIKGKITLHMLELQENELNQRIQADFPNQQATLSDLFDVIVGTSTGGIIAHGLRNGMPAANIRQLYMQLAGDVFGKEPMSFWTADRNGPLATAIRSTPVLGRIGVGGLYGFSRLLEGSWYHEGTLRSLLQQHLQGAGAAVIPANRLYVTTLELTTQREVFVGDGVQELDQSVDTANLIPAIDAMRMTSAAPGYFKPVRGTAHGNQLEFVDGGLFANNPTRRFLDTLNYHTVANPQEAGQWNNPIVVSLGTGIFTEPVRGRYFWQRFAGNVVQSITETESTHRNVALDCYRNRTCYHRLNVHFPPNLVIEMDAYEASDLHHLQRLLQSGTPRHTRVLPGQLAPPNIQGQHNFDVHAVIDDCLGS